MPNGSTGAFAVHVAFLQGCHFRTYHPGFLAGLPLSNPLPWLSSQERVNRPNVILPLFSHCHNLTCSMRSGLSNVHRFSSESLENSLNCYSWIFNCKGSKKNAKFLFTDVTRIFRMLLQFPCTHATSRPHLPRMGRLGVLIRAVGVLYHATYPWHLKLSDLLQAITRPVPDLGSSLVS